MSRSYASLPARVGIDAPRGGVVRSAGDVYAPTTVACTPTGTGFGPLYVGVPDGGGYCTIKNLRYVPDQDDGDGFLIFGLAAGGPVADGARRSGADAAETTDAPENPPANTTRREVLALAGATLAAGVVGADRVAAQSDDLVALHIAEFEIQKTSAPVTIRVLDIVDEVLPPTTELLVDAQETRVGKITDPSEGVALPSSTTGSVRVYLRDARGRLERLFAWARGVVGGEEEITYSRELPQKASSYDQSTFVRLSDHPAIVEPVRESGPSGTELTIGNTRIPHTDESASEAGAYAIFDNSLVYEVGSNPPAAREWGLRTRLGLLEQLSEGF